MQYIKINCTCLFLLFKVTTRKFKMIYVAHIVLLLDRAILDFIDHDTLRYQSRKFPTLYPFIPFQDQAKAILPALSTIPGEWWSF